MDIIVGEEINTTDGEITGLFLNDEIPSGLALEETIDRVRDQDGIIYIPHPYDRLRKKSINSNKLDFADIIEIFKSMLKVFTFLPFIWGVILFPYLMRLYGLKCGKNVHIATNTWIDSNVEIGDNTFVGWNTALVGHANENRQFVIEPAKIGKNCTIGSYCVVAPGVDVGDNTLLGVMSGWKKGTKVPPNGIWIGTPAKLIKSKNLME